jgi:putative thiazole-containing bacteriocin maturation protein
MAEGVCRGLQKCLTEELRKRLSIQTPSIRQAQLAAVEDECCRYYIQALTTLQGTPEIWLGEEVFGFPAAWVGTGGHWYGCVGLNRATALRQALVQALQQAQNEQARPETQGLQVSSVHLHEQAPHRLEIPHLDEAPPAETLKSALQVLERNRKRLLVFQLIVEPFLKEEPIEVFGVLLREEMPL